MSAKNVIVDDFRFNGIMNPAATASAVDGPWSKADTSAAGSPTVGTVNGGLMELALTNTNEAQNLCLYFGDKLPYDIDDLLLVEIWAKITASLDASVSACLGMGSARNDTMDSVAANAWFRLQGNNTLLVETDDGTNDNDDKSTGGLTLSTTLRRLVIDFGSGIQTRSPPFQSIGGKGDVRFYAENGAGLLVPVARNVGFDMSNYADGLQPVFQLQKTAGTAVGSLSLKRVRITHREP